MTALDMSVSKLGLGFSKEKAWKMKVSRPNSSRIKFLEEDPAEADQFTCLGSNVSTNGGKGQDIKAKISRPASAAERP